MTTGKRLAAVMAAVAAAVVLNPGAVGSAAAAPFPFPAHHAAACATTAPGAPIVCELCRLLFGPAGCCVIRPDCCPGAGPE
ncbi:hypothetical protein B7R87_01895 [Streptomyces tsukubensis]|nr:hypothetical protein B7R87_01895 [Streptomyces tsukubensis]